jgi:ribosomal protein S18 acetylase RimI-like enzyme
MEIQIRRATLADAKAIAEHNAAMARETENLELDRERLRQGVEAVLRDPGKGFYTVAEVDGKVVGQMMVTFEWSDWRNATFWWLQSVYVQPEFRGRGVYRRLYEHVLAEAKARHDICGVRLYVSKENQIAQRVYERLGLKPAHYAMYEVDFVLER